MMDIYLGGGWGGVVSLVIVWQLPLVWTEYLQFGHVS